MVMSFTKSVHVFLWFGLFFNVQGRTNCPAHAPCLSKYGFCGTGPAYCGPDCRGGPCTGTGGGGGGGGGGGTFQGEATHYSVSAGYTACGTKHGDGEMVAALNAAQFDPHTPDHNPNRNRLCNKQARVTGPRGTAVVRIVDRCPGCKNGDLDLSNAAFQATVGDFGIGRARITWSWA